MKYYKLTHISYCFPYETERFVDEKDFGVFKPYLHKKMTEKEADDLLCKIIKKHPFMEDAMFLKFHVSWIDSPRIGSYQVIYVRSEKYNRQREGKNREPSPIRWRE